MSEVKTALPTIEPTAAVRDVEHVASLDALRGVFALFVAIYHFSSWTHLFGSGTKASSTVAVLGIYAVEGFFIISGFCFFHLYGVTGVQRANLRGFHIKRYLRIAPLYYFAFALNLVLGRPVGPMTFQRIVENLTLTFGFFHPNHARVLGGWSIGIEYVFYFAFPLLAWLLRRRSLLYGATALMIAYAVQHGLSQGVIANPYTRFHAYVELPNHAFLFLLGGVLADLRRHTSVRISRGVVLLALGLLSAAVVSEQAVFQDHFEVMQGMQRVRLLLACFVLVLLFTFERPAQGPLQAPLRWLGDHSYSVYLLHPFASAAISASFDVPRQPLLSFVLGLVLALVFAALSRRWLEVPAIAWGKRLSTPQGSPKPDGGALGLSSRAPG